MSFGRSTDIYVCCFGFSRSYPLINNILVLVPSFCQLNSHPIFCICSIILWFELPSNSTAIRKRQAIDSAYIHANASMDSLVERDILDDVSKYSRELNDNVEDSSMRMVPITKRPVKRPFDKSMPVIPMGFDFGLDQAGKRWINNGKYWAGFGIGIDTKLFGF